MASSKLGNTFICFIFNLLYKLVNLVKDQIVNILDIVLHMVSIATTHFCNSKYKKHPHKVHK